MYNEDKFDAIIREIEKELDSATDKFGPFNNAHEGYAVILGEMDELWDTVKLNQHDPTRNRLMKKEAIQTAAMVIRLLHDCCKVS